MSLTGRTAALVQRILESRDNRSGRDKAVMDRARKRQQRATEVLGASVARGGRRRAEVHSLLREIERRHQERSAQLARLGAQEQTGGQKRQAVDAKSPVTMGRLADVHAARAHEHLRVSRQTPPGKGSGKK